MTCHFVIKGFQKFANSVTDKPAHEQKAVHVRTFIFNSDFATRVSQVTASYNSKTEKILYRNIG